MFNDLSYRRPFIVSCILHGILALFLLTEHTSARPVLQDQAQNTPGQSLPLENIAEKPEIIHAVSVDSQEIEHAIAELKQQQQQKKQAEIAKERAMQEQALALTKKRQAEEARIKQLKIEADQIALAKKKKLEEEKKHLEELAKQKEQAQKKLAELKKQAEEQKNKLSKAAPLVKKPVASAQVSQEESDNQAMMSGEVDKYKALILNAISRNWILPDSVNPNLSSKFNIKLASNGNVLEVKLLKSSGDPVLDRSAQAAIYKASPLPVPHDPKIFAIFREISLTVRAENALY